MYEYQYSDGRIWFMLSSIFAENEREILKERTHSGLASAKDGT
jgi:DNA invertase Pin-like site-specific DNA recombinase